MGDSLYFIKKLRVFLDKEKARLFFKELTHRCKGLDMVAKYLENH